MLKYNFIEQMSKTEDITFQPIQLPSHLSSKAKGPHSQFSDAVVLQKDTLGFVGHTRWYNGQILSLAADRHG